MTDAGPIRNHDAHDRSKWNWHFLNRAIADQGKNRVGDVDGMIERYGYVLVLETKSQSAGLTKGQRIMAERSTRFLCECGRRSKQLTVMIVKGDPGNYQLSPAVNQIEVYHDGRSHGPFEYSEGDVGREQLIHLFLRWYNWATKRGGPGGESGK